MRGLFVLGRAIFGGYFVLNGVNHLQHMGEMTQYANAKGVPVANLVHASGNAEEAEHEIGVWFTKAELFDYPSAAQQFAS